MTLVYFNKFEQNKKSLIVAGSRMHCRWRLMALIGSLGGVWSPQAIVAETPWRHDKLKAGGGGAIDIGVHQMDIARYVMGEVSSVLAVVQTFEKERIHKNGQGDIVQRIAVNVDDTYFAGIKFTNQALGQLLWSWAGHGRALEIPGAPAFFGSRGCIQKDQLLLDDGTAIALLDEFEEQMSEADRSRLFPLSLRDPYAILQLEWLRGIAAGGQAPETSGEEGLRDLAAAFAFLESAQAGRTVTLEEVLNGSVRAYQQEIDEHYTMN